jgi:hypothetical protein
MRFIMTHSQGIKQNRIDSKQFFSHNFFFLDFIQRDRLDHAPISDTRK